MSWGQQKRTDLPAVTYQSQLEIGISVRLSNTVGFALLAGLAVFETGRQNAGDRPELRLTGGPADGLVGAVAAHDATSSRRSIRQSCARCAAWVNDGSRLPVSNR